MRIFFSGFLCLCLALFYSFQGHENKQLQSVDKIIAIVGDEEILKSDVEIQYAQSIIQGEPVAKNFKCEILKGLVMQKILAKQAAIDSIEVSPAEVEDEISRRLKIMIQKAGGKDRLEEFLGKSVYQYQNDVKRDVQEQMVAGRMQQSIISGVSITPHEVQEFYKKIPKDSLKVIGATVEVGQIIIKPKLERKEKEFYKNKAEMLRLRVLNGESFETLARLYSDDQASASAGGDLGYISKETVVKEFAQKAFSLAPGEISNVFESSYGFHFLKVIDRQNSQVRVKHILIIPRLTPESIDRAKHLADSIYQKVAVKKELPFSAAAALYSDDDESKHNGGFKIYYDHSGPNTSIPMDKLDPNIAFEINAMHAGDIAKPKLIQSAPTGNQEYIILYLKSRTSPHTLNMKDDFEEIKSMALEEKKSIKLSKWFEERRKATYIQIDTNSYDCKELNGWTTQ